MKMPFVQAVHFTRVTTLPRAVSLIVLHSMENQEKPNGAENVALWFGGRAASPAPKASAHFCVDSDSIVQCVEVDAVAWHAPGANRNGIGVEIAGRASQTREQWRDPFSLATIENTARLTAWLCRRYALPVGYVASEDLVRPFARGITTHDAVSRAFKKSTHTDPGINFPLGIFLTRVAALVGEENPLSGRTDLGEPR
jgi:N-acetyl-anhydromuramyl-L-alanine amidase AmpD